MSLNCPQCGTGMKEVKAEAKSGYCVLLDQCSECGGVWCDRWELFPVTAEAAQRLDPVAQEALSKQVQPARDPLTCPRCRARMRRFGDPWLPPDARIDRCPNCEGMWLNRGELQRVKSQGVRRSTSLISDSDVDRLAVQVSRDPKLWPTVVNLDNAMQAAATPAESQSVAEELLPGAMWLIARAALRLLLHI